MNNAEITPDVLQLIKENNQEAYLQWQREMQEDINKRIANLTTPRTETNVTELFNNLVKGLNIEA